MNDADYYVKALTCLQNNDYMQSETYYIQGLEKFKSFRCLSGWISLYKIGHIASINKISPDAYDKIEISLLNLLSKFNPEFIIAKFYYIIGNSEKAKKYYLLDPFDPNNLYNLAIIYIDEEDFYNAEICYKQILESHPQSVETFNGLGYLYQHYKINYIQSEHYYLEAIKLGYAVSMNNLAYLYQYDMKDYVNAEKYYLMAIDHQFLLSLYIIGMLYKHQKNYELSLKYLVMYIKVCDDKDKDVTLEEIKSVINKLGNYKIFIELYCQGAISLSYFSTPYFLSLITEKYFNDECFLMLLQHSNYFSKCLDNVSTKIYKLFRDIQDEFREQLEYLMPPKEIRNIILTY